MYVMHSHGDERHAHSTLQHHSGNWPNHGHDDPPVETQTWEQDRAEYRARTGGGVVSAPLISAGEAASPKVGATTSTGPATSGSSGGEVVGEVQQPDPPAVCT